MEHRVFACEGLDGTGKTTVVKEVARQSRSTYHIWSENHLARFRSFADKLPVGGRFLFYVAIGLETYRFAEEARVQSDVFLDRTMVATRAYHLALGVPPSWMSLIPQRTFDQFDQMFYFTVEEKIRLARMQSRLAPGTTLSYNDGKSIELARSIDLYFRNTMPAKTTIIDTSYQSPAQLVDSLYKRIYE